MSAIVSDVFYVVLPSGDGSVLPGKSPWSLRTIYSNSHRYTAARRDSGEARAPTGATEAFAKLSVAIAQMSRLECIR